MPTTSHPETETDRVRRYTSPEQLQQIDQQIEKNVRFYSSQPPEVITRRIEELKREWSIERYLQINVSTVTLLTAGLALMRNRAWAVLTCGGLGFFLFHGLRGFDPPLPILRGMGIRTRREIDRELFALKIARGDFQNMPELSPSQENGAVSEILKAVNR